THRWASLARSAARVGPAVRRIQHREHRAPLRALADLARPREQLRLPPAEPVHRHEHEPAIEGVDDRRALERDRVVGQQLVQTERRSARRRLHAVPRGVRPLLLGLRLTPRARQLDAHDHTLRPLRRPDLEALEDHDAPLGPRAHRVLLQLLDRSHVRGLGHADLAVVDLHAELRHQGRLDVPHHLLRLDVARGQDVDLAHLAERRHHHARRQDPRESGDQVLGALYAPRIGDLSTSAARSERGNLPIAAATLRRIRCRHVSRSPVATRFLPEALALYRARSAATSTSSDSGARPGANSAPPMLTVTRPAAYPRRVPIASTLPRTLSATPSAPSTPVRTSTSTNSSPP